MKNISFRFKEIYQNIRKNVMKTVTGKDFGYKVFQIVTYKIMPILLGSSFFFAFTRLLESTTVEPYRSSHVLMTMYMSMFMVSALVYIFSKFVKELNQLNYAIINVFKRCGIVGLVVMTFAQQTSLPAPQLTDRLILHEYLAQGYLSNYLSLTILLFAIEVGHRILQSRKKAKLAKSNEVKIELEKSNEN